MLVRAEDGMLVELARSADVTVNNRGDAAGGRQQWDFGRFVKTVTYFNQPPTPEEVLKTLVEQPAKLVRQLTGTEEVGLLISWLH